MPHKVHPYIFRLGKVTNWKSRWFSRKKYKEFLKQDIRLRDFLFKKLNKAGIGAIEIERSAVSIRLVIKTARPGLIIGRGGGGIEELKSEIKQFLIKEEPVLSKILAKIDIRLDIEEISRPESQAAIVAWEMAAQIEKRFPFRRVMKQGLEKIMQHKEVKGAKVTIGGRLDGNEIARTEWLKKGRLPLQNLRADIDYAQSTAYTTYGTVGIKVWIYKGEIF